MSDDDRPPWRALFDPLAIGVVGVAGGTGLFLHSVPVVAVGALAYGALVAWELVGKGTREVPVRALPTPALLPSPDAFADPDVRQSVVSLNDAQSALWLAATEAPDNVLACVLPALSAVNELTVHALELARRAEGLHDFLRTQDRKKIADDAGRLQAAARKTRDAGAREGFDSAATNRAEQLTAVDEIADARDRAIAALAKVVTAMEALPAKIVRMKALDATAMDAMGDDVATDLSRLNSDISVFEQTLRSLAGPMQSA